MVSGAREFLQGTAPFAGLDAAEVDGVLQHVQVRQFPRGTIVYRQGDPPRQHLYIVQVGAVKIYLQEPGGREVFVEQVGAGEAFGISSLIDGKSSVVTVEAIEDTTCLLLHKDEFWRLFVGNPAFSEHFIRWMARRLKTTIGAVGRVAPPPAGGLTPEELQRGLDVSSMRVKDLVAKRIVSCSPDTDIRAAAGTMVDDSVGSIVVLDDIGQPAGIVTDTDLRRAFAVSYSGPVRQIMSSPVVTISPEALVFEAIYEMLRHGIHHMVVTDGALPVGVVSNSDLLSAHSDSPMLLAREIERAKSCAQLTSIQSRTEGMIKALIDRGVSAYNLGRITAETNDRLVQKIIRLVESEMVASGMGLPPVPYCWLGLGSEGRREQTVKTDQDNALVYQDPPTDVTRETQAYFQLLASRVVEELANCGFPLCKGGVMASNPKWCQPLSQWKKYFSTWVRELDRINLLNATIFFDFRPIWGTTFLADELREHLHGEIRDWKLFLTWLAESALGPRPPLGFFKNFVVEKDGEHKGKLNLKHRGLLPLVNSVRVYSLEHALSTSNTYERVRALEEKGVFSHDQASDIAGAYEFITLLRIRHQIDQIKAGQPPDNFVNPKKLSPVERRLLKGYFAVISSLQTRMESRYQAWFMG